MDLKELHRLRILRNKEKFITNIYSIENISFKIIERPGYLFRSSWNKRQNSLLKYLLENKINFKNRNILVLLDGIGFCGLVMNLIGANVTICEEKEYWSLIETNMKLNNDRMIKMITPLEYKQIDNMIYDYIIISETIYSTNIFEIIREDASSKIILGIRKDFWEPEKFIESQQSHRISILSSFPDIYTRRQVSVMKSDQNVIFELEKKQVSWLEFNK